MSASRAGLSSAFERTIYRVHLPGQTLDVRIGERHPQLDAWLQAAGARRWIILSPCNPGARLLPPAANDARMARLRERLETEKLRYFPAVGIPPAGEDWPPEPSLLILDATSSQAARMAGHFGQLAWVEGARGQPAELVWSLLPKV